MKVCRWLRRAVASMTGPATVTLRAPKETTRLTSASRPRMQVPREASGSRRRQRIRRRGLQAEEPKSKGQAKAAGDACYPAQNQGEEDRRKGGRRTVDGAP